jgi:hypothetical protein
VSFESTSIEKVKDEARKFALLRALVEAEADGEVDISLHVPTPRLCDAGSDEGVNTQKDELFVHCPA